VNRCHNSGFASSRLEERLRVEVRQQPREVHAARFFIASSRMSCTSRLVSIRSSTISSTVSLAMIR
jgi:hypothetical protein